MPRDLVSMFNPAAWYWRSGNGRVFSSAAGAVVPKDDAGYVAWLDAGNTPTVWPSDDAGAQTQAALDAVLSHYGVGGSAAPAITYKLDLYTRATDQEAEEIEMALASLSVKKRRMFEECRYLDHADPLFAEIREAAVGMFGAERADTLLAPSAA